MDNKRTYQLDVFVKGSNRCFETQFSAKSNRAAFIKAGKAIGELKKCKMESRPFIIARLWLLANENQERGQELGTKSLLKKTAKWYHRRQSESLA